ncbi:rosmarinate synthase-like [Andrographis paniculata]|uniref:rosmarinate synthase-like n=1 Tax=Andrographis paniculata TaxID=175694 RepID=UPI0021E98075|nr:rosmarinate synthase-like [Andrographis paniculata]
MVEGMKIEVKVKEEVMVRPAAAKTGSMPRGTTLWLSNLDTVFPLKSYVDCTFFFRSIPFFNSSILKATLGRALAEYYPLAGRLKWDEQRRRLEVECNGEGVLFIEATANGALLDLGANLGPRPDLTFVPVIDFSKETSALPLFMVQVTRFTCGGICFAFAIDHHLCDGFSAVQFLRTWADIVGCAGITLPPFHDRQAVLSARHPPQLEFDHIEYQPSPTLIDPITSTTNSTSYKRFRLTPDQVKALKAQCKISSTNQVSNDPYTTYEVITGHAWRCVSMARRLPKNQPTKLHMAVDGRERLLPRLPPGYFGNVVFRATPIALAGDLQENPVGFSVLKVHEALVRMDDRYMRSAIDYLEIHQGPLPESLADYRSPNLGIISWARLPLYDDIKVLGKPIYAGPGSIPGEGRSQVLPAHDGSLLYAISLPEQEMAIFEKLFYDI